VVINVAKSYYCTRLGARIAKDIRERLFDHLQKLPLQFVNDRRPGELMNRVVNDTGHIREFMQDTFCNMFTVAFIFVAVVLYMLYLNWKMALLSFLFVPVGVWMTMAFRKSIHRRFHLQYLKEDDVSSNLQDVLSGMRVVKSYGKEEREKDRFNELSDEYARVAWNNERFWALFNPAVHRTLGSGVFLVLLYGGSKVINEEMTAGMLMQFMTYTTMLYQYVQWMTNMPRQITNLIASMERINDVMNQEEYGHGEEASEKIEIVGKVEFQHASFGYKSYEPVLEDINLTVKPGEMIGIVGPSGAGKSTLINLLMGLYEIDDGALLIDGVPIEKLEREHFHQQIGVVLQETRMQPTRKWWKQPSWPMPTNSFPRWQTAIIPT
jgi:ATP-binding cassette subfamily B protein